MTYVRYKKTKLGIVFNTDPHYKSGQHWISLYIDLSRRKVTEFEDEKIKLMDDFIRENKSNFSSEGLLFSSKLKK